MAKLRPRTLGGKAALALPPLALAGWLVASRLSSPGVRGPVAIAPAPDPSEARPGGATTIKAGKRPGIGALAPNLSLQRQFDLSVGRAFFRDPWIAAPATTVKRDGLGPLFNAHSCVACHPDAGRARAAAALAADATPGIVLRLGRGDGPVRDPAQASAAAAQQRSVPDPTYGDELQTRGLAPIAAHAAGGGGGDARADGARAVAEGAARVDYAAVSGRFADGEPYELRRPTWRGAELAYGPLASDTSLSARAAPALAGVGLLEAIPEQAILAHADPDDRDGDGISGRPNRVWDLASGQSAIGRFGWKASQPTVRQQVAAAFRGDIGITSELYPEQPCTAAEPGCVRAPSGADQATGVEIDAFLLGAVTDFTSLLGVSPRPRATAPEAVRGRELFHALGCAACHVPGFTTADTVPSAPELSAQRVWPYTDLLLHDMGPDLADGQTDFAAGASEWRTAPLWGLGLALSRKEPAALLHDGRARTLDEAILWHGGEAADARDRFVALPGGERAALRAFLESL